ncbi:FecCD family ABC transporter permease [Nocardia inohanensis]|uniref:FecCD family ABC transporter permease n=1 Tax=Nocardia inohanensis TaxID=209246 RepID=UPI00082AD907|nr:iron ABC transporter permease [Nocardia inohanensis]
MSGVIAGIRRRRRRAAFVIGMLVVAAVVTVLAALAVGPVWVPLRTVVAVLGEHLLSTGRGPWSAAAEHIVWGTRAPRIVMAAIAGAVLAAGGAVLQAVVRNYLADPFLLGLNSGASTGVALVVLLGGVGAVAFSGAALAGAVGAMVLVLAVAGAANQRGPLRLVLSGLAVGYALNAATSLLIFTNASPEAARSVMFWLLGSLAVVQPAMIVAAGAAAALGLGVLMVAAPMIDALASGDDSARAAGIAPERARLVLAVSVSAMVGVVVAGVGGVGFIGLVTPQLARRLVGGRHRLVIPAAALLGAIFLVVADTIARTVFSPREIPVGVVTGIVGAPLLLVLLRSQTPARR